MQTKDRQDPKSHYGSQRGYIFLFPDSLDLAQAQSKTAKPGLWPRILCPKGMTQRASTLEVIKDNSSGLDRLGWGRAAALRCLGGEGKIPVHILLAKVAKQMPLSDSHKGMAVAPCIQCRTLAAAIEQSVPGS